MLDGGMKGRRERERGRGREGGREQERRILSCIPYMCLDAFMLTTVVYCSVAVSEELEGGEANIRFSN